MAIQFPKELPDLQLHEQYDSNNFSRTEKEALKQAFKQVKLRRRHYARRFFVEFLSKHERLLCAFRNKEDGLIDIDVLIKQPHAVLGVYVDLVDKGLFSNTILSAILSNVRMHHENRGIDKKTIQLVTADLKAYILRRVLHRWASPTLSNALDKLNQLIIDIHD